MKTLIKLILTYEIYSETTEYIQGFIYAKTGFLADSYQLEQAKLLCLNYI